MMDMYFFSSAHKLLNKKWLIFLNFSFWVNLILRCLNKLVMIEHYFGRTFLHFILMLKKQTLLFRAILGKKLIRDERRLIPKLTGKRICAKN